MKIINAKTEILRPDITDGGMGRTAIYGMIELAGRTCYKSDCRISESSGGKFVHNLVNNRHEAMLEHAVMTVKFTVDRAIANEIVRHRLSSYAQESTRYCNYGNEKFGREITVIKPYYLGEGSYGFISWKEACLACEKAYFDMLGFGCSPEQARAVLPLSLKTELIMTANMREWRHFFQLRAVGTTGRPHPQMLEVAVPLLRQAQEYLPELFGDLYVS